MCVHCIDIRLERVKTGKSFQYPERMFASMSREYQKLITYATERDYVPNIQPESWCGSAAHIKFHKHQNVKYCQWCSSVREHRLCIIKALDSIPSTKRKYKTQKEKTCSEKHSPPPSFYRIYNQKRKHLCFSTIWPCAVASWVQNGGFVLLTEVQARENEHNFPVLQFLV